MGVKLACDDDRTLDMPEQHINQRFTRRSCCLRKSKMEVQANLSHMQNNQTYQVDQTLAHANFNRTRNQTDGVTSKLKSKLRRNHLIMHYALRSLSLPFVTLNS